MNLGRARHLTNVDGDEVSLVRRAANKRRFLLTKGDEVELNPELAEMLSVPADGEGALIDEVRKDGGDETTEEAVIAAVRLLKGVGSDLSRETVEKLGQAMYPRTNDPLNTGNGEGGKPLNMADDDDSNWDTDDDEDQMAVGKRDVSADERKNLADDGDANSDGSFPIANKGDLDNAIKAFGHSKNPGKTKSLIIRRAKALGATSMLPESWNVSKSTTEPDEGGDPVETHAVPIQKEDGTWDLSSVPSESRPFYEAQIRKAAEVETELEKTREALKKSADETAKLADTLRTREFIAKAADEFPDVGPTEEVAQILKAASDSLDEETYGKLETILKSANERIATGDLFAELGRASRGDDAKPSSAYAEAVAKATEMVEKSGDISLDVAMGRVFETNPALYNKYLAEKPSLWSSGPVDAATIAAFQSTQGGAE